MSHRLMNRKTGLVIADGTKLDNRNDAAMFSVRENPWHSLGRILDAPLTAAEALKESGCDYEVKVGPIYTPDMKEIEGFRRTFRNDNDATLGVVGNRYHVIQNADAFGMLDAITQTNEAIYETAGALGSGETVWALCKLPKEIKVAGEDYNGYFLVTNTHDGNGALKLRLTPIRVVCQNTLNLALGSERGATKKNAEGIARQYNIRHTVNYENKIAEAKRVLGIVNTYYTNFENFANDLLKQKFSAAQIDALVEHLIPKPGDDASKRAITNFDNARTKLYNCFAAPDLANIDGTAWMAVNAVADYSDHCRDSRGTDDARRQENAVLRTLETDLKDKALEFVLAQR